MDTRLVTASLLGALLSLPVFAQQPAPVAPSPGQDAPDALSQLQPNLPMPVDGPALPPPPPRSLSLTDDFGALGGFGGFGGFGALGQPPGPPRVAYSAFWEPAQHVSGQNADLSQLRQDLTLSSPLWVGEKDAFSLFLHVRNEQINTSAILPDSRLPFPEDLWDIRAGVNYYHLFDNGWSAGGSLSIGSASDKPFSTINEVSAGATGFLRVPSGDRNAWLFSLSYDSNSQLPFPVPGVAYSWQVNDQLHLNVGLPFQINYRPLEDLSFDFNYMLLTTVQARVTYQVGPTVRVYAAYNYGTESYFLADRTDPQDRFFYNEMRLTTGLTWNLTSYSTLDLSGGYAFDRQYYEGHNSTSETDVVQVAPGPFVALRLGLRY
jgi:hypothetical protein